MSGGQGGRSNGYQQPGGAMGNSGFVPTPRVGQFPGQPAGTGGVRSPAGPYGPPGFIGGGSVPVSGAQPLNPGSGTTGGVGTTMQPNGTNNGGGYPPGWGPGESQIIGSPQTGGLEPAPYGGMGSPAPTNGPRLPPIPPEFPGAGNAQAWGNLYGANKTLLPTDPAWFSSPQGLQQGVDLTQRLTRGMGPGTLGTGGMGGNHPAAAPNAGMGGRTNPQPASYKQDWRAAGQPNPMMTDPAYRMQEVLAGRAAPGTSAELQAMMAQMSPADRQAYIDRYRSIGLDLTFQPTGGGSGPFGNGIAS